MDYTPHYLRALALVSKPLNAHVKAELAFRRALAEDPNAVPVMDQGYLRWNADADLPLVDADIDHDALRSQVFAGYTGDWPVGTSPKYTAFDKSPCNNPMLLNRDLQHVKVMMSFCKTMGLKMYDPAHGWGFVISGSFCIPKVAGELSSDVDLFLVCDEFNSKKYADQANIISQSLTSVQTFHENCKNTDPRNLFKWVEPKENIPSLNVTPSFTTCTPWHYGPEFQFINRIAASPEQVYAGFDIGICQFACFFDGNNVHMSSTYRALFCLYHGLVDTSPYSLNNSHEYRLLKYMTRMRFHLFVPGFHPRDLVMWPMGRGVRALVYAFQFANTLPLGPFEEKCRIKLAQYFKMMRAGSEGQSYLQGHKVHTTNSTYDVLRTAPAARHEGEDNMQYIRVVINDEIALYRGLFVNYIIGSSVTSQNHKVMTGSNQPLAPELYTSLWNLVPDPEVAGCAYDAEVLPDVDNHGAHAGTRI